jgi:hypothetical protein
MGMLHMVSDDYDRTILSDMTRYWWLGALQSWYQRKKVLSDISQWLTEGVTNWYHSPFYKTDPRWVELTSCRSIFSQRIEFGSG